MQPKHVMPKFLERFSCIGGACEDTCCQGWRVTVDERHYLKLKHAMDGDKQERQRFRESHQRTRGEGKSASNYAFIVLQDNGMCGLLDSQKMCSVQKKYGGDILSDTCATYPRLMSQRGDELEVTASFSCPEVARQALLAPDAMDLVEMPESKIDRRLISQGGLAAETDPYKSALDDVRGFVMHLLSQRQYPITARLFFVTYFGHRTQKFFVANQPPEALDALLDEMQRLMQPAVLDEWAQQFAGIEAASPLAANLVIEVLRDRLTDLPDGSFRELLATVLLGARNAVADGIVDVSPSALWTKHVAAQQAVDTKFSAQLDLMFENYAKNYWFREWYTRSPNLFVHARKLLVRIAVMRFLLLSHPDIVAVGDDSAAFDRLAVEVFYKFSRGVEHSKSFLERVETILNERGLDTLAHTIFLLKF